MFRFLDCPTQQKIDTEICKISRQARGQLAPRKLTFQKAYKFQTQKELFTDALQNSWF